MGLAGLVFDGEGFTGKERTLLVRRGLCWSGEDFFLCVDIDTLC